MIAIEDVDVAYGGVPVLASCSIAVHPGELVALVGDNGCGKSTIGRLMSGAQLASTDRVQVDGHDPKHDAASRARVRILVGRVGQDPADQIVSSLVFDEVAFGPRNLGLAEDEVEQRVFEALGCVGMAGYLERVTTELSGGEQQRIALAGVLAMRPRYLVLDEPTSQLDAASRPQFRSLFEHLAHDLGLGIALITHDAHEIACADRVVQVADFAVDGLAGAHAAPAPAAETPGLAGTPHAPAAETPGLAGTPPASAADEVAPPPHARPVEGRAACMCPAALQLEGVSFAYGPRHVLHDVSFSLHPGEVVLLTGVSGAGKSTLAAIAAGLIAPDRGTVRVCGLPPAPGSVGFAFQRPESQFFLDTVYDEIACGPRGLALGEGEVDRRVRDAMRDVGLDGRLLDASPFELSGGQARRVGLASVLALETPVYILDEPTAALDAPGRRCAHRFVTDLAARGCAVLVITHDVDEWRPLASRELILSEGLLIEGDLSCQGRDPHPLAPSCQERDPHPHAPSTPAQASSEPVRPSQRAMGEPQGSKEVAPAYEGSHAGTGGYVPGSFAARLDARVKIILLMLSTVGVFAAGTPLMVCAWTAVLAAALVAARMPPCRVMRGMRPVIIVLALTLIANLISCDGRAPVSLMGSIGLDPVGGLRGLMAIARIFLLVGFSLAVASSTTGPQISDACVRLLGPLARIGVPVGPLGAVFALALRFIPLVSAEFNRIRLAQTARGMRFDDGSLVERIGVWTSVLTPLVIGLFRRADLLAEAMSARGYDARAANRLPAPRSLAMRDRLVLGLGASLMIVLWAAGLSHGRLW